MRVVQATRFGRPRHWIRPVIGQTFPPERAADAHAAIEARGVIGQIMLLR